MLKIGFYQFAPQFGKVKENLKKVVQVLSKIKKALIVLPELFNTGYLFASKKELNTLGEAIPQGITAQTLIKLAQSSELFIVGGILEKFKDKFYNSAVLVGPSGLIGVYRKIHLFNNEKKYFSPGDKPLKIYSIKGVKIGIMICFDWFFPETARILALGGAQIICHPANLVLPYCPDAMITRSLENKIFTITANRVGGEKNKGEVLSYIGKSQIVSPQGARLAKADSKEEKLVLIEINPKLANNKKIFKHNHIWKDRRIEFYKDLIN
ncbi:MAG: acyltransferase [Armatimonadetes bacterium]|nr:acyltransferase [Armatimonadota bacterium]